MEYIKKNEYFVGIDSDGTAFDSMRIKPVQEQARKQEKPLHVM